MDDRQQEHTHTRHTCIMSANQALQTNNRIDNYLSELQAHTIQNRHIILALQWTL